ncbi:hypothetical protein IJH16_03885 [Candidatus Saccharibacteria bacterium]|nr:hypothetical protein [Candidatus Saccharibacteria bacterium]
MLSAASPTPCYTRRYPLSYVFSGNYWWSDGNLSSQNSEGRWRSATASGTNNAHYVYMGSSVFNPQSNAGKADGFSLRCASREKTQHFCGNNVEE